MFYYFSLVILSTNYYRKKIGKLVSSFVSDIRAYVYIVWKKKKIYIYSNLHFVSESCRLFSHVQFESTRISEKKKKKKIFEKCIFTALLPRSIIHNSLKNCRVFVYESTKLVVMKSSHVEIKRGASLITFINISLK